MHAVYAEQLEVAQLLLQRGATVGKNSVRLVRAAANRGHQALTDLLLDYGADPTSIGAGEWTLYPAIADTLLSRGADVNQEPGAWIGMCCTGNSGHQENVALAQALLRCGANTAARYKGRTALHCAAKAGFVKGDVIVSMNGQPVTDSRELQLRIVQMAPSTTVRMEVLRDGRSRTLDVTLGTQPGNGPEEKSAQGHSGVLEGLSVDELTPQIARQLNLSRDTHGVVVSQAEPDSAAGMAGLHRGDVIQEANRKPVYNVKDFEDAVRQGGDQPVLLLVNRGGNTFFVALEAQP